MARIGAILISLCLSTLLASCGSSRSGIDPAARAAAIEQAHQEADAQLALAAQALVEAQAEAETAQACRVALDVATMRFDYIAVIIALANVQASFAEGYWPWPEEAWLAGRIENSAAGSPRSPIRFGGSRRESREAGSTGQGRGLGVGRNRQGERGDHPGTIGNVPDRRIESGSGTRNGGRREGPGSRCKCRTCDSGGCRRVHRSLRSRIRLVVICVATCRKGGKALHQSAHDRGQNRRARYGDGSRRVPVRSRNLSGRLYGSAHMGLSRPWRRLDRPGLENTLFRTPDRLFTSGPPAFRVVAGRPRRTLSTFVSTPSQAGKTHSPRAVSWR